MYSAVETKNDPTMLQIRARDKKDLENLRPFIKKMKIVRTPLRDYEFRIFVPKTKWAAVMAQLVNDIDYGNFKDEVKKKQGSDRAHIYMGVWLAVLDVGEKFKRWPKRGNWGSDLSRYIDPWEDVIEPVKRSERPTTKGAQSKLFASNDPPKTFLDTGDGNLKRLAARDGDCPNCQWPIDDGCMCESVAAGERE